ncbi:hypothetical protein AJ78_03724 [Emergomyces pasteurianus Ep9510]|uniref:Uncharacterized protein n=1 Tax=Emergomyces pasteurianus Ep9510 TaxID=1447872 RepID=A0A1J9Q769_9EURO|nr:hypothetical protein AJ78_03724 [Emergomyces pasteurianus Ep9510]
MSGMHSSGSTVNATVYQPIWESFWVLISHTAKGYVLAAVTQANLTAKGNCSMSNGIILSTWDPSEKLAHGMPDKAPMSNNVRGVDISKHGWPTIAPPPWLNLAPSCGVKKTRFMC